MLGSKMEKNKTKVVETWDELLYLIEGMNPFRQTIILSGFINRIKDGTVRVEKLIFSVRPVEILKNDISSKKKGIQNSRLRKTDTSK